MSSKINIRKITTLPPNDVFIQWTLENPEEEGNFSFSILKSDSPSGDFELLNENPIINGYRYIDPESVNYRTRTQHFYVVKCVTPSGLVLMSDAHQLDITPKHTNRGVMTFGIRRVIQYEYSVLLRKLAGSECAVLKRRHSGTRCTVCYDSVTRLPLLSHCDVCKGTGWVGGYHNPYYCMVRIGANHISSTVATDGKSEINQVPFKMLDYPLLDEDDVIVQLNQTKFFRVKTIETPSLITQALFQQGTLFEIAKGDVEYSLTELLGGNEATIVK